MRYFILVWMWLILNGIFNIRLNVEFEKNGNILGLWLIYYFDRF